jgi:hypothetical protein
MGTFDLGISQAIRCYASPSPQKKKARLILAGHLLLEQLQIDELELF